MTADEVLSQSLQLSANDRARVAYHLLLSLEPDDIPLSDEEWTTAWIPELDARVRAYERGETAAIDWRESIRRVRESLRSGKPSP